jgi:hypothetical protein
MMKEINYSDKCLECGSSIAENSKRSLGIHLSKYHEITLQEYTLKHYFNGEIPLCECGCGDQVSWHKTNNEYNRFISGHNKNKNKYSKDNQPSYLAIAKKRLKSIKKIDWSIHHIKIIFSKLLIEWSLGQTSEELGFEQCKICYRIFDSKRSLANHLLSHDKLSYCIIKNIISKNRCKYNIKAKKHDFYEVISHKSINIIKNHYGSSKYINHYEDKIDASYVRDRFTDIDYRKSMALDVFGFYREHGFPYIQLSNDELNDDFTNLCNQNSYQFYYDDALDKYCFKPTFHIGKEFIYHFSPQFFDTKRKGGKSFIEIFNDDNHLMSVINNRMHITYDKEYFGISGAMIRRAIKVMKGVNVSVFDPSFARFIYDRYTKKDDVVLDISTGFGHRYLGAMSLLDKNLTYIGVDPWEDNIKSIENMHQFLGLTNKLHLHSVGSELMSSHIDSEYIGKVNLCFSSPPYFDMEIYDHGSSNQAISLCNYDYDKFINEWWKSTVDQMMIMMAPNSKIILNLPIYTKNKKEIGKDMINMIINNYSNWKIDDEYYLSLGKLHYHSDGGASKNEHIFILSND